MTVDVADASVDSEGLWVRPTSTAGEYVVDNIPFFARGINRGDTVTASDQDGELRFEGVTRRGDRTTFQLLVRPGIDAAAVEPLFEALREFGAALEGLEDRLVAIDVEEDQAHGLVAILERAWNDDLIWYESRA